MTYSNDPTEDQLLKVAIMREHSEELTNLTTEMQSLARLYVYGDPNSRKTTLRGIKKRRKYFQHLFLPIC